MQAYTKQYSNELKDVYSHAQHSFIIGKKAIPRTFYGGSRICEDFLEKNQEIAKLYPSEKSIEAALKKLRDKTTEGYTSILEITERGITELINFEVLR